MEIVMVYTEAMGLQTVGDGVDPEEWASVWGVRNYPYAIYFILEV